MHTPPASTSELRIRYTHAAMADIIIASPGISQNEIAKHFGYTASWVSQIVNSDAFQALLAARKAELVDPVLILTTEERIRGVTNRSLEVLADKLAQPSSLVPDQLALKAFELGAKAMGVGGNAPPPPPDNRLEELAKRLIALRAEQTVEGVVIENGQGIG